MPEGRARVCLTGAERNLDALAERLKVEADLHEVRLDYLERVGDDAFALIERFGPRLVVACRPKGEFGAWVGSEAERLEVLLRAKQARPAFLDVELSVFEAGHGVMYESGDDGPTILVSYHGQAKLAAVVRRLGQVRAQAVKVAIPVEGASDLIELLELGNELQEFFPTRVIVGMGPAGIVTRIRPSAFSSAWTYCPRTEGLATASGQLTFDWAKRLRVLESPQLEPIYLVGGTQVLASPGPEVYNSLFATLQLPFQYLPLPATRFEEAVGFAARTGARFLSVTMPLKQEAARLARTKDRFGEMVMAVNTVRLENGAVLEAHNTDALAALDILAMVGLNPGDQVLVLGRGGSALAVGTAAHLRGARVLYAVRNPLHAHVIPWADRHSCSHSVLVNCTPVGSDGTASPWDFPPRAKVVVDLVMRRGTDTKLVQMARAAGVKVFSGLEFWAFQGAHQMGIMTGRTFTPFMLLAELARQGWLPAPPQTVALVGMRGAGKTTVGKRLAKRLGWQFVDSDSMVEERLGRSIAELFATGEMALFRRTEADVLHQLLGQPMTVVATGGGAVEDLGVRAILGSVFTVWLTAPAKVLSRRIEGTERPSLTGMPVEQEVSAVLEHREPYYRACASLSIATDDRNPEEVCDAIIHAWHTLQGDHLR